MLSQRQATGYAAQRVQAGLARVLTSGRAGEVPQRLSI